MTDIARTERLRRLQELRLRPGTTAATPHPRRSHPASSSRRAALGLGASLTVFLIGALSGADAGPATGLGLLPPTGVGTTSVLVPIHRTLYLVSGAASEGNWAATPGASGFVSSGAPASDQTTVTTHGSQ